MRREAGIANLLVIAVGLPILLLLFYIAIDLSRIPLGEELVSKSARFAITTYWPNWAGDSKDYPPIKSPFDSANEPLMFGLEPLYPAAINLCPELDGVSDCNSGSPSWSGVMDFSIGQKANYKGISDSVASHLVFALLNELKSSSWMTGVDVSKDVGVQLKIVWINKDDLGAEVVLSEEYQTPNFDSLKELSPFPLRNVSEIVAEDLIQSNSGLTSQVVCSPFSPSWSDCYQSSELPAVGFVVGVVYARIQSPIATFSFISSNIPASAPGNENGQYKSSYLIQDVISYKIPNIAGAL